MLEEGKRKLKKEGNDEKVITIIKKKPNIKNTN
jgi:hypothetical protein